MQQIKEISTFSIFDIYQECHPDIHFLALLFFQTPSTQKTFTQALLNCCCLSIFFFFFYKGVLKSSQLNLEASQQNNLTFDQILSWTFQHPFVSDCISSHESIHPLLIMIENINVPSYNKEGINFILVFLHVYSMQVMLSVEQFVKEKYF